MAWLAAPVVGMAVRVCVVAMAVETVARAACVAEAAETAAVGLVAVAAEAVRMVVREAVGSAQGSFASLHQVACGRPELSASGPRIKCTHSCVTAKRRPKRRKTWSGRFGFHLRKGPSTK